MKNAFRAVLIEQSGEHQSARIAELSRDRLPEGDVTVRLVCSTLNKDALAITGRSPVVRSFPMVPGIDIAGVVEESSYAECKPGDAVVLNGWGAAICPIRKRREAWNRLARDLDPSVLDAITQHASLEDCIHLADRSIAGTVPGRLIVPL